MEETEFKNAEGAVCAIVYIEREIYIKEERPYPNEHA